MVSVGHLDFYAFAIIVLLAVGGLVGIVMVML
jgi:hypothetical protein